MTVATLGDAVELAYGRSLPVRARRDGSIPVYGSNGVVGFHDEALVREPTVIVGRKGSVGAIRLVSGPSFPIDTTYFVRARPGIDIDIRYAAYALKHIDLSRLRTETGVPGLNREDAYREPFLLPPLVAQRRIVEILDRAARIEALRRRSAERLREFVPALFVRMFGDPVENPMGWAVRPLADLVKEFRYGTSRKCYDSAGVEESTPVLRVPNILRGRVDWTNLKFASLRGAERTNLSLERGDILFVRTNGNPEYIGRCAVFSAPRQAAYASYLIRARLKRDGVADAEYVSSGLALPTMRQTILRMTRTTAGNYNIGIDLLGRIPIPVPDPQRQQEFSATVARARETMNTAETCTQSSLDLSQSLMTHLLANMEGHHI